MDNIGAARSGELEKYFKCRTCGLIADSKDGKLSCCGTIEENGTKWPPSTIRKYFQIVFSHDTSKTQGRMLQILLLKDLLEILFRKNLMDLKLVSGEENFSFFNSDSSHPSDLVRAYNKISDISLESLLQSRGFSEYINEWHSLYEVKNELISADFDEKALTKIKPEVISSADNALSKAIKISIILHNDIKRQLKNKKENIIKEMAKTVLIVDDEDDVRNRLYTFIEKNGAKPYAAGLGFEAIDMYKKYKPDFVFLDVMLPDLDGLSVLKKIKEFDADAKVYFFTGVDGESFKAEADKLGACGHLVKPVQIQDILKVLRK